MTDPTITHDEMARRMGVTPLVFDQMIADADRTPPRGPNRSQRRAAAKQTRKGGGR